MLITGAVYVSAVLLLCAGFYFAHLVEIVRHIAALAGRAYATMTDDSLDDLAKEKVVQRCAVQMLKHSVQLIVKLLVILLVTALPVWLASFLGWTDMETFAQFALRVDVLLITTAAVFVVVIVYRRMPKPGP